MTGSAYSAPLKSSGPRVRMAAAATTRSDVGRRQESRYYVGLAGVNRRFAGLSPLLVGSAEIEAADLGAQPEQFGESFSVLGDTGEREVFFEFDSFVRLTFDIEEEGKGGQDA